MSNIRQQIEKRIAMIIKGAHSFTAERGRKELEWVLTLLDKEEKERLDNMLDEARKERLDYEEME